MFFFKKNESKKINWLKLLYLIAVFFIFCDLLIAANIFFEKAYKNKIYPGVMIGEIPLGGKTLEEAKKIIDNKLSEINQNGIKFAYENNRVAIMPIVSSFSGDLAVEVISFDSDKTAEAAFSFGRSGSFWQNAKEKILIWKNKKIIPLAMDIDEEKIKNILEESFLPFGRRAQNAELYATTTPNYFKKEIIFKIKEEKIGIKFDYNRALEALKNNLKKLDNSDIEIAAEREYPEIRKNECFNIEIEAQQFLDKAALALAFEDKKWPISQEQIAGWLTLARGVDNKIVFDLNAEKIKNFLEEKIAPAVEIKPVDARFEIKDGRVVEFTIAKDGRKIDEEKTIASLRLNFLSENKDSSEIITVAEKSQVSAEEVNTMGIKEIIGTGHSNFSGSPKNRLLNIKNGAKNLQGLLIAPGEEFSTIKSVGEITEKGGYYPELVIKGNQTIPEFGGGLCQIGTTMFRTALASGLPITARRPHSYRVTYYEPAGTDATIYDPSPDLKFINDTGHYILIQTRIDGNDLYFDFWGTKDERVVEKTDPIVTNIVKPAPKKIIETTNLKPGEIKCTEKAHNGADASFNYKVTYPDGTVKEETFKSHYVPWREVCLVGVEKLSSSTPEIIASGL